MVFGYTTAIATEGYPKVWVSNKTIVGMFLSGMLMELVMFLYVLKDEKVDIVFKFNRMVGDWVIYDTGDSGDFLFVCLLVLVRRLWELLCSIAMALGLWLLLADHCLLVLW